MRYFDGAQWTDNVSNAGVQSVDPLNGPAAPTASAPGWNPSNLTSGLGDAAKQVNADMLKKQPPYFFLIAGGALLLFIGSFMTWAKVSANFGGLFGSDVRGFESTASGFDAGFVGGTGTFLMSLLLLAYAAIRLLKLESKLPPQSMKGFGYGALAASGLCVLFTLYRIADVGSIADGPGVEVSIGIGLWISFLAAGAALAGAVMEFLAAKKQA